MWVRGGVEQQQQQKHTHTHKETEIKTHLGPALRNQGRNEIRKLVLRNGKAVPSRHLRSAVKSKEENPTTRRTKRRHHKPTGGSINRKNHARSEQEGTLKELPN